MNTFTTQYTTLLLELELLDKAMREQRPQTPLTIYDPETSGHLAGGSGTDGNTNNLAECAAAA